jgi:hypothetical protein
MSFFRADDYSLRDRLDVSICLGKWKLKRGQPPLRLP